MFTKRLNVDETIHGIRSSFRIGLVRKQTLITEISEMAFAHSIGNKVETSYRRGICYKKEKLAMNEWEHYLS